MKIVFHSETKVPWQLVKEIKLQNTESVFIFPSTFELNWVRQKKLTYFFFRFCVIVTGYKIEQEKHETNC